MKQFVAAYIYVDTRTINHNEKHRVELQVIIIHCVKIENEVELGRMFRRTNEFESRNGDR